MAASHLAIPLAQTVNQCRKLNAAALIHAAILENGPGPVRTGELACLAICAYILDYWSGTADDYGTQVANLVSSNGVPLLDAGTVTDNGGGKRRRDMAEVMRIALVGDFDPAVTAHRAIPEALRLSAQRLGVEVASEWVHTTTIGATAQELAGHAAVWCVPASPYANTAGALAAIRYARESLRPFLGTCGGFQHAILEYARNVLGYGAAEHAETVPDAAMPVIARLTCSLVEKRGSVRLIEGSRLRAIYGTAEADEGYHCNYGLNPAYEGLFSEPAGLRVAARDTAGEVRAVELAGHPFFIATLFQPERSSLHGLDHPLINTFVAEACRHSTGI
jgi:CTP synthase (UTP-ammonia lyase)